jgi:hypothetical protein
MFLLASMEESGEYFISTQNKLVFQKLKEVSNPLLSPMMQKTALQVLNHLYLWWN